MRLVLDTNILVSSLLSTKTPPDLLYQAWKDGLFELISSQAQLDELARVLAYDRLKPLIPPGAAQKTVDTINAKAIVLEELPEVSLSPDPADNFILAIAIAGKADYLVTGDKRDLLFLKEAEGIPIITARAALEILSGHQATGL